LLSQSCVRQPNWLAQVTVVGEDRRYFVCILEAIQKEIAGNINVRCPFLPSSRQTQLLAPAEMSLGCRDLSLNSTRHASREIPYFDNLVLWEYAFFGRLRPDALDFIREDADA
jgi:hypothetical protein